MGKQNFRRIQFLGAATLLALTAFIGCSDTTPALSKHPNVRAQFKDNFKSALENMVTEAKTSSSEALSGALSAIQRMLGHSGSNQFGSIDADFLNSIVDKIFESEMAKAIFAETNVISRTDNEVIYGLKPAICTKLSTISAGDNDLLIKACEEFLTKNSMEFHTTKMDNDVIELGLWHDKKFIMSLGTSSTSIGVRANLGNAKNLVIAFMNLIPQDSTATAPLAAIKKLEGALSVQLRFKSAKAKSGCKDGSPLCLIVNVDEDLDIAIGDDDGITLKFAKSPMTSPTLMIGAGSDGAFRGSFNLGAIDLAIGASTALSGILHSPEFHVSLESSAFDLTFANDSNANSTVVMVENFKSGKNASFFEGFGKKIMLDLANDSRTIEMIKVAFAGSKVLVDLSPLALLVSMSDDSNDQCRVLESLKVATSQSEGTALRFTGSSRHFSNGHFTRSTCGEGNLFVLPFWGFLRVANGAECDLPLALVVDKGSLEMSYAYDLNGTAGKAATLSAAKDQCLRI